LGIIGHGGGCVTSSVGTDIRYQRIYFLNPLL
jgi:hypothetical protein